MFYLFKGSKEIIPLFISIIASVAILVTWTVAEVLLNDEIENGDNQISFYKRKHFFLMIMMIFIVWMYLFIAAFIYFCCAAGLSHALFARAQEFLLPEVQSW